MPFLTRCVNWDAVKNHILSLLWHFFKNCDIIHQLQHQTYYNVMELLIYALSENLRMSLQLSSTTSSLWWSRLFTFYYSIRLKYNIPCESRSRLLFWHKCRAKGIKKNESNTLYIYFFVLNSAFLKRARLSLVAEQPQQVVAFLLNKDTCNNLTDLIGNRDTHSLFHSKRLSFCSKSFRYLFALKVYKSFGDEILCMVIVRLFERDIFLSMLKIVTQMKTNRFL